MIRVDHLLFGYRVFTVDEGDVAKAAELFLKNNISVRFCGNKIYASVRKSRKIKAVIEGAVTYSSSEILGIGGFLYKNRNRWGVASALVFSIVFVILSGNVVWDVRIEGCECGAEEEIIHELSECGFEVGSIWSRTDKGKVEAALLERSRHVSWVNINRRGTVAYVKVIDKVIHDAPEEKTGYSSIVAARDAVIEEITVIKGFAAVKVGDTVKKGDLLISGIIPSEIGGGFCYAEGIVVGRVSDCIEVCISDKKEEKVYDSRRLKSLSLNIFNFSANIFNRYGNYGAECDIIEQRDTYEIFIFRY